MNSGTKGNGFSSNCKRWSEARSKMFYIVTISKTGGRGGPKRFLIKCVNFLFVMSTKGKWCGGLNIFPEISPDKVTYGWRSRWRIRWLKALVITSSGSAPRVEEGIFLQSEPGHYTHHQVCARSALTIEYIQSLVLTIKCARSALYWLSQCKPSSIHCSMNNVHTYYLSLVLTIKFAT